MRITRVGGDTDTGPGAPPAFLDSRGDAAGDLAVSPLVCLAHRHQMTPAASTSSAPASHTLLLGPLVLPLIAGESSRGDGSCRWIQY
jgi:hypothetical protein